MSSEAAMKKNRRNSSCQKVLIDVVRPLIFEFFATMLHTFWGSMIAIPSTRPSPTSANRYFTRLMKRKVMKEMIFDKFSSAWLSCCDDYIVIGINLGCSFELWPFALGPDPGCSCKRRARWQIFQLFIRPVLQSNCCFHFSKVHCNS